MHTSLRHSRPYGVLFALFSLPAGLAKPQQGLEHAVINVTTAETIFDPITTETIFDPITAFEPVTATDSWDYNMSIATAAPWTYTEQCPTPTSTATIYSLLYTSPDASPVAITTQSQVVTSYFPEMTWCVAPEIAVSLITPAAPPINTSGPFPNATAPYLNTTVTPEYTTITSNAGGCETIYAPIETTVCATTLTGLASKVTITKCDQQVTFSSECGFSLETPSPTTTNNTIVITPAPTVKRLYTYWLAPWQSLTAGDTPSDVDVKICTARDDGSDVQDCERYQEVWEVIVVTRTLTSTRPVWLTATISGPGTLIVESSSEVIITDTIKTIDLSTTLLLETEYEEESTSVGTKTSSGTSTVYITKTLLHNTPLVSPQIIACIRPSKC